MVASMLWEKYHEAAHGLDECGSAGLHQFEENERETADSLLDAEVAKLGHTASDLTHVGEVFEGILATLSPLTEKKAIHLTAAVPTDLPPVSMSRAALRQALLGILLSSIDWGHGCQVALTAFAQRGYVDLEILLQHPRAVSFPRATMSSWDTRIAVSSRLIQMQGGTIRLHSNAARIRFILQLPAGQRCTVLIVDDNPDTLSLFHRYLAGGAYELVTAGCGAEALRLAQDNRPDVIILDVMMPSLDGWETLQALRNHPETRDVPIIVCSVLHERELALALGAADCLSKPVSQEELVRTLCHYCRKLIQPHLAPP